MWPSDLQARWTNCSCKESWDVSPELALYPRESSTRSKFIQSLPLRTKSQNWSAQLVTGFTVGSLPCFPHICFEFPVGFLFCYTVRSLYAHSCVPLDVPSTFQTRSPSGLLWVLWSVLFSCFPRAIIVPSSIPHRSVLLSFPRAFPLKFTPWVPRKLQCVQFTTFRAFNLVRSFN